MERSVVVEKWRHQGLLCQVNLNEGEYSKWYCGYVAVTKKHPFWRLNDDTEEIWKLRVHGGITFTNQGASKTRWRNKNLWWFGFDCAHGGDKIYKEKYYRENPDFRLPNEHEWTLEEVVRETNNLAEQLADMLEA